MSTINWPGQSGAQYQHWIHPIGTSFKDEGGNYVYAKETSPGQWAPLYIGQTNSLKVRLGNHETEAQCKRDGATHIHAHTNGSEAARLAEERDLIALWKPSCNTLLK